MSDKLHNARAILRDYRDRGEDLWRRFRGGKGGTLWYYRSLADFYDSVEHLPYADELERVVAELERFAVRGSRRHILNWVEAPDFRTTLNRLLEGTGAVVAPSDSWWPLGWDDPAEARLDGRTLGSWEGDVDWTELLEWWLVHPDGANVPNWDLLATCTVGGRHGLVLVEAKAHEKELSPDGKKLEKGRSARSREKLEERSSARSRENHDQIGQAIEDARQALEPRVPGIAISRDTAYQLSNRIGHAWWLASHGVPVVLVYLGFTGDERIGDVGAPFRDDEHWQAHFRGYAAAVLPAGALEEAIDCGAADFQVIVRSLPATED